MNEATWLACQDSVPMLKWLTGGGPLDPPRKNIFGARKLRLFAVASMRLVWVNIPDPRSRKAVEVAERYADGETSALERTVARGEAREVGCSARPAPCPTCAAVETLAEIIPTVHESWFTSLLPPQTRADLVREIVGNPFKPILPGPWLTDAGVSAARQIYDGREFGDLPMLADFLEEEAERGFTDVQVVEKADAYCFRCGKMGFSEVGSPHDFFCPFCKVEWHLGDSVEIERQCRHQVPEAVLAHLRGGGLHFRGCWVIDLLIGKS